MVRVMVNCPQCGSESIQIKQETNVNWGRAIVGTFLFGVVGGAVGAVTGEDRNANICLNCGATWKAAVLYEMLNFIKKETGKILDLTDENERQFLNEVMRLMSEFSEEIEQMESQARVAIQSKKEGQAGGGCGCLVSIILTIIIGMVTNASGSSIALTGIVLGCLLSGIGSVLEMQRGESLEDMTKSHEERKRNAEKRLKINFNQLRTKYLI